jgi:glycine amidinotransferase
MGRSDTNAASIVSSHNEWDPLEEVIVGDVRGAMHPAWNVINCATLPEFAEQARDALETQAATPFSRAAIEAAEANLADLIALLEGESIRVRRPALIDHSAPYKTPSWSIANGFCAANPRDAMLVVGDEIIEAPMPDRGRHFEVWAYRELLLEYFQGGARWTAAPRPRLLDSFFDFDYEEAPVDQAQRYVIGDQEPVFDAADFVRCGRDIVGQLSHVTNRAGIDWLRRHLGDSYSIHLIETRCRQPMHIDTTLAPLAPGKLLVNPEFVDPERLPDFFDSWDILVAPAPAERFASTARGVVSDWMSINVLMLDQSRMIVEERQGPLIAALRKWGFEPIPCAFESYYQFAGSFHCATLDIRRHGALESYR